MKKRNRETAKLLRLSMALLMSAVLLGGCGSAMKDSATAIADTGGNFQYNSAASDEMYMPETETVEEAYEEEAYEEDVSYEDGASKGTGAQEDLGQTVASNRKLIKRVNMDVETQEFDSLTAKIEAKVAALGGYMEESSIYGNGFSSDSTRNANYTARVPVGQLENLVTEVAKISNVTNKSESATDVTLEYVDTKSRKEALLVEQERLMALLEQADTLETIIGLESRLTEVRYEIQTLESKLRTYDNLVDYATVSIYVREVKVFTPTVTPEKSTWEKMCDGFINSLQDVGLGIVDFFVGLVIALPYLVVWAVVIFVFVIIIKAIIRGRKKKKEKKMAKQELLMKEQNQMIKNAIEKDFPKKEAKKDAKNEKEPETGKQETE